jgi:hypothetical protein
VAVCKKFEDMKNKGVGYVIPKEKIPEGKQFRKANGYSRLRGMGSSGQDWWRVRTPK